MIRNFISRLNLRLSRGSIRSTMFASFTLSALVAVFLTGLTLYVRFSGQMDDAVTEENQLVVEQAGQSLNTFLRDVIRLSDSISYNVVKNTDLTRESIDDRLRLLYNTYSDYVENIAVFTRGGEILAAAPPAKIRSDAQPTQAGWFQTAIRQTENIHFGTPTVEPLFQDADYNFKWVVSLSCAVELTMGTTTQTGVLLMNLKYSAIESLLSNLRLSGNGYVYLTDGTGKIIYHPFSQRIATGLYNEDTLGYAVRNDGVYTDRADGGSRSIIVRGVGYTGWRVVGVVHRPAVNFGSSQDILFILVIFFSYFELIILANYFLSKKLTDPIRLLEQSVDRLEQDTVGKIYVGGTSETRELGRAVQQLVDQLRKLADDIVREHEEKVKSELNALQSQINPHFLYNTLDTIVWMIENERPADASRAVTALARLFRISLSKGRNIIPLRDELEHVRNYLLIQEMRYKNKFQYIIDAEDAALDLSTIKLVVQPIVENAIYHSMDFMDGDGLITIHVKVADGELLISVEDNGLGMPSDVVEQLLAGDRPAGKQSRGSGIGLKNVQERIRLYFGACYGLTIVSEPDEGTTVTLRMPAIPFGEMEEK